MSVNKALKECQRYTLSEAMDTLKKQTRESFPELIAAVQAGEIKVYAPGRYSKPMPSEAERLRLPRGAWCGNDKAEIFSDDLNAWLSANFPRVAWRFPVLVPATEPTPDKGRRDMQVEAIVQQASAFQYPLKSIPYGGKAKIKTECLKNRNLFTDSGFDHAWDEAKKRKLIEVANVGAYRKPA